MQVFGEFPESEALRFGLAELKKQLGEGDGKLLLRQDKAIPEQGYHVKKTEDGLELAAADEAGMMYGLLDTAEIYARGESFTEKTVTPYIRQRGIKFNIPLDARTPSYSDESDSAARNIAYMWEKDFWRSFLDRMALDKYNVLSLWSLSPFPSMVRIPEFPLIALEDVKRSTIYPKSTIQGVGMYSEDMEERLVTVKRMSMDDKIAFWRWVMEYAKTRCIRVMLFTWNLFVYGTEHNPYGITNRQDNPATERYLYCAVKALLNTYPLLAGLGVTAGEDMKEDDTDIPFLARTYGRAVREMLEKTPERDFHYIHRMQYARYDSIMQAYSDFPGKFEISFKYSQAHMYSDPKPGFINAFLKEKAPGVKLWLTVRNDDFYMFRWGDPAFASQYLKQMPVESMEGFYMGPDGFTWGMDFFDRRREKPKLVVDKMWYMFSIWGKLSYQPDLPETFFEAMLRRRWGLADSAGRLLYRTWKAASGIIPMFNCVHWHDFDFQWYPEGCCMYIPETEKLVFADILEFESCGSIPGGNYSSVREYCRDLALGRKTEKITPLQQAQAMLGAAEKSLEGVALLRRQETEAELDASLADMEALARLGIYAAHKIQSAVQLCMFCEDFREEHRRTCLALLKEAAGEWQTYAEQVKANYDTQVLTRMCGCVDVGKFTELARLDVLLAEERMRNAAEKSVTGQRNSK